MVAEVLLSPDSWVERLGVAGLLAVAAYIMLKWFMRALEKQNDENARLYAQHAADLERISKENSTRLIEALREGYQVQRENAQALNDLRQVIREGKFNYETLYKKSSE